MLFKDWKSLPGRFLLILILLIGALTKISINPVYAVTVERSSIRADVSQNETTFPTVVTTSPKHGDVILNNPSNISVQYSVNMLSDGTAFAVNKITNYLLVEDGEDGKFQTSSCVSGQSGDDLLISISKVTYNATNFTSTLTIPNWPLLNQGSYQLLICASTRITDTFGNKLNDGKDIVVRFVLIKEVDLYPYVNLGGGYGEGVGIGDFNHDGLTDVVMSTSTQVLVYLKNNNGNLNSPSSYQAGSRSETLAVGDLNNDGWFDVVTADFSSNTISVFLQQSNGTLAPRITFPTSTGPDAIAVSDITGDGLADIVISHWNSAYIGVFTQNTDGTLNPIIRYNSTKAGSDDIAIGDVNNDGLNDVVKMNGQGLGPDILVYLQNANGTLTEAISYDHSCNFCVGNGIGIGDVTGDGLQDVVMSYGGNRPSSKLATFAQGQDGLLQSPVIYESYDIPESVELADINLDGKQDVLTLHGGWLSLGVYLQKDGLLQTESLYTIPNVNGFEPQALAIGDIDQDGAIDVAISDDIYGLTILYYHEKPLPQVIIGGNTSPMDGEILGAGISQITIQFDRQMKADGSSSAANNVSNYLLVNSGLDDNFQTDSCTDGPAGDDSIISVDHAIYSSSQYFSTLSINSGIPLEAGEYRLFVCGTTSIEDINGVKLNGGLSDGIISFTVWPTPYKISGNAGVGGAVLNYVDHGSKVVIADGYGDYSINVSNNWSGTVTPSKTGYAFTPGSKNYVDVTSDVNLENYTASLVRFTISGNTGIGNAILDYFDGVSKYVESDINGDYSFTVPMGWSGYLVPSKSGYEFTPDHRLYINVQSDQLSQDFIANSLLIISGNTGIDGAAIFYEGDGLDGSTTAAANGSYSISVPTGWSGFVTPSKPGYRFSPINRTYNSVQANQQNQDFTPIRLFTISGNVGIGGAVLSYEEDDTTKTATTTSNGSYSISVHENWSGTITPSRIDYIFVPSSKSYDAIQGDQISQNYTAVQTVMTISGNVSYEDVTLSYIEDGSLKTVTSDTNGYYSLKVNAGWSGMVTPSKLGIIFDPVNKSYTNIQSNQADQDYKASILVTSIADSGPGSLRQAILDAEYGDMISFHPDLAGQTITLESTLRIGKGLTINGSGLNPRLEINGNGIVQIFSVDPGYDNNGLPRDVKFQSLVLKNGKRAIAIGGGNIFIENVAFIGNSAYDGGAIHSGLYNTTLTITQSDFTSNSAQHFGGAIRMEFGSLTLRSSIFTDNSADIVGGAISIERQGPYTFEDNTFSNNSALSGGAIRFEAVEDSVILQRNLFSDNHATLNGGAIFEMLAFSSASFTLNNNTFYANQAGDSAGAISISDPATITNNTFSHNQASRNGASLYRTAGVVLRNNIFSNGIGAEECYLYNPGNNPLSGSHNMVDDGSSACLPLLTGDPLLGPLTDNGGPTLTMALMPNSLAIEAGDDLNCIATDQRGVTRPQGSHCDIGAYEAVQIIHSIPLVQGWNLVSFRVHPTNTDLASVLSSIEGNYDLVYAWDATGAHSGSGNWLKADNIPASPDSLTSLNETMGFWIHMVSADTLDVMGTVPQTTNITLLDNAGGWNLVSYPSSVNGILPSILADHGTGTDLSLVYAYHPEDAEDVWKLFDTTAPIFVNDLTQLVPGLGYWIKVNADLTWVVESGSP